MDKISIGTNFFIPMPVVLVGTQVNGKANFMAVGWCTRANANPPMLVCGIGNHHYTPKGITRTGTFSVNIPSRNLLGKTDYCGLVSGAKVDKSEVFSVFYGNLETAPMIRECPLCMECKLIQAVDLPSNTLFIGQIMGVYTEEKYLTDGKPDILKINPFTLTMPDNQYWKVGQNSGKAWGIGKNIKGERA